MRLGIFAGDISGARSTVSDAVAEAQRAADDGFTSFYLPQIFGVDALTTLAVIGAKVPRIELGTSVVPSYPRHPAALAQQALTVQSASAGRLTLGVGLSHKMVIENMYGYSFERPLRHMREYLSALGPLLQGKQANVSGETLSAHLQLDFADAPAPEVLLAALGNKMLRLAAELADGTVTWMTGRRTLADHIVPTLTSAADGVPKRVVAALPVAVTSDTATTKAKIAKSLEVYGILPSYRAMLDREGVQGPEDVGFIGDAETVAADIRSLFNVGVTEFVAVESAVTDDDRHETRALLKSLL